MHFRSGTRTREHQVVIDEMLEETEHSGVPDIA